MRVTHDDARSLVAEGCVVLSGYDSGLSRAVQAHFHEVVAKFGHELSYLCFEHEKRPDGRHEPDDGFIDWTKGSNQFRKDLKYVFHYRPDLVAKIGTVGLKTSHRMELEKLLELSRNLYQYHSSIALAICLAYDGLGETERRLADELMEAISNPAPASRSVLRLLYYPASERTERAKVHFDRSLLTLHAGDAGGSLFAVMQDGERRVVSPGEGQLLAFWGCKARHFGARHGATLKPLAHGSHGSGHEDREAVVSFWHNNHVLWDSDLVP